MVNTTNGANFKAVLGISNTIFEVHHSVNTIDGTDCGGMSFFCAEIGSVLDDDDESSAS